MEIYNAQINVSKSATLLWFSFADQVGRQLGLEWQLGLELAHFSFAASLGLECQIGRTQPSLRTGEKKEKKVYCRKIKKKKL